ncbi:hypothetical protein EJ03DRAFT_21802 [Teratosphaeria nubilosa]|uniref:Uncharacterized protein n=1 Tax=Teratosphaeria nubilosa TaxID=161662 RepID=A0A6G1LHN7_9PEZI|nr:hypothetical protein EJ03DRAFT_21802 [Teratosphaeria nubilosa]
MQHLDTAISRRVSGLLLLSTLLLASIGAWILLGFAGGGDRSFLSYFATTFSKWQRPTMSGHQRMFFAHDAQTMLGLDVGPRPEDANLLEVGAGASHDFLLLREDGEAAKHVGVSMIHQLHCVKALRQAIRCANATERPRHECVHNHDRAHASAPSNGVADPAHEVHLLPCLDCIAQVRRS